MTQNFHLNGTKIFSFLQKLGVAFFGDLPQAGMKAGFNKTHAHIVQEQFHAVVGLLNRFYSNRALDV